jgi:hypothetical protein
MTDSCAYSVLQLICQSGLDTWENVEVLQNLVYGVAKTRSKSYNLKYNLRVDSEGEPLMYDAHILHVQVQWPYDLILH